MQSIKSSELILYEYIYKCQPINRYVRLLNLNFSEHEYKLQTQQDKVTKKRYISVKYIILLA